MSACFRSLGTALTAALVIVLLLALPLAPADAGSDIAIVVLHGKQGFGGDRTATAFLRALQSTGYVVQASTMCWSRTRICDAAFPDCLREIDTTVAALHAAGTRRIVVAGQSLGGDAAIVYGVQHPELAGVIALAPAGQPEQPTRNPRIAQSVAQARQMVAAGQGSQRFGFTDANNGQTFAVTTTPTIFLSFLEPGCRADFAVVLPRLRAPVIWVAGTEDRTQDQAATLFARLPASNLNGFVQVNATHLGTTGAGAGAVLDWLKTLPGR